MSENVNSAEIVGAIEENLFSFFPLFRYLPGAGAVLGADLMWNITDIPFPLFNSIMRARLEPGRVDSAVRTVIEQGRRRKVPLLWWTGPATMPADLGRTLEGHGFTHEGDVSGMAADLQSVPETMPGPPGLVVSAVRDRNALDLWCRTATLGFEMPDFVRDAWLKWFTGIGMEGRGPLFHFLGLWKGEPVAASSVFLAGGAAGLYNVTVLPEARQKGIGAAMTVAPLLKARSLGYSLGILHSTPMGMPLYKKLGFKEYCRIGHYMRTFDGNL